MFIQGYFYIGVVLVSHDSNTCALHLYLKLLHAAVHVSHGKAFNK